MTPVLVWERKWRELRWALSRPLAVVAGKVSRREGTLSVVAERAWPVDGVPLSGDFGRRDWRYGFSQGSEKLWDSMVRSHWGVLGAMSLSIAAST